MTKEDLQKAVNRLAVRRLAAVSSVVEIKQLTDEFMEGPVKELGKCHHAFMAEIAQLEKECRAGAIEQFQTTGEKVPVPGLTVSEPPVLKYDEGRALLWAKDNPDGKKMLKLVTSKFEKAAKALDLDFVSEVKEPYCTISSRLIPPTPVTPADEPF